MALADPRAGEPLLAIAARERAGRIANARRLKSVVDWYACLQALYAKPDGRECKP